MKRYFVVLAILFTLPGLAISAASAQKKPKPGPLTGTWECMSEGGEQGDMPFTLYLEQDKEVVTGSASAPIGSAQITSASFRKNVLEIHIDTPEGNYTIMGKLSKGQFSGTWSVDTGEKGTWEGKKASPKK